MRILFCSAYLPPYAPLAAARISKLAAYLWRQGHDLRLYGAKNTHMPRLIEPEFPTDNAVYADFHDPRDTPTNLLKSLKPRRPAQAKAEAGANGATAPAAPPRPARPSRLKQGFWSVYETFFALPDPYCRWAHAAPEALRQAWPDWRPNIIYATAPPHSSSLAAHTLAEHYRVPWVAELRDLWTSHPYYDAPWLRRPIERRLENKTLGTAAGLVTVTRTWETWLGRYGKPTLLAMNGFAREDYVAAPPRKSELMPVSDDDLVLVYAGALYGEKRDPRPILRALKQLSAEGIGNIRLVFYTPDQAAAQATVDREEAGALVHVLPPIGRKDVLLREQAADILLLLRWDNPAEDSVIAGKLFEYIGARRPILSVGRTAGEAAEIIRDNGFGLVSNDPDEIAAYLKRAAHGDATADPAPHDHRRDAFDRVAQFEKIERFLAELT